MTVKQVCRPAYTSQVHLVLNDTIYYSCRFYNRYNIIIVLFNIKFWSLNLLICPPGLGSSVVVFLHTASIFIILFWYLFLEVVQLVNQKWRFVLEFENWLQIPRTLHYFCHSCWSRLLVLSYVEVADWSCSRIPGMGQFHSSSAICSSNRTPNCHAVQCLLQLRHPCVPSCLLDADLCYSFLYAVCTQFYT